LAGEAYCHAFAGSFDLPCVALRFANVYGPRSEDKQGVVTNFVKQALRGQPLTINGDGTATRDFVYVEDVCGGICAALAADIYDDVFHLATGCETSVDDVANLVREEAGVPDLPSLYAPHRPGDVEQNFARFERATLALGYRPAHPLPEGIRRTIEWFDASRLLWE
jgi:UDP-glucose 4-epimerase